MAIPSYCSRSLRLLTGKVTMLGVAQTPAIDAVLEVLGRGRVLERLDRRL